MSEPTYLHAMFIATFLIADWQVLPMIPLFSFSTSYYMKRMLKKLHSDVYLNTGLFDSHVSSQDKLGQARWIDGERTRSLWNLLFWSFLTFYRLILM
jgi:hypothetical protein